jgi:enterochelin esterase-like enzyme
MTPLACWDQPGRTEDGSLRTNLLPLPLDYRIHLPPCYDQEPDRHYPVLFLIHGQNYNNDQWDRLGADETAKDLVAAGQIAPFILVLPRDRWWNQPTENNFGQVLIESLIPWVDENYRTLPERSYRSIGGLSRGAAWAVHLGLSHWELFGALGAHSLPVFWTDTFHIRAWLDAIPLESMPRIYMDTGEKDYLIRSTLWFEGVLNEKGIPHEWYLFPGYHEEAYWQSHVEQYLRWYAQNW